MHPAFSVIGFTTAAGAGYGLLIMLALTAVTGLASTGQAFRIVGVVLGAALVTVGLLASMMHLGRPERAWRAFSQWRSSWLSREGIASVLSFAPIAIFGVTWAFLDRPSLLFVSATATILFALATLITTGMIYASLKPIPQWHGPFTVPGYLVYATMSGAVLAHCLLLWFSATALSMAWIAIALIAGGWLMKLATWRHNDRLVMPVSRASALGLREGAVRSLEWPHTEENYVMKEMGFRIGRKHARKLRLIAQLAAFAIPLACLAAAIAWPTLALLTGTLAVASQALGLFVERWLFFAEAKHVVGLYYGRD